VLKWIILGFFVGLLFAAFKVRELYRRANELSRTDPKTGALSERGFVDVLGVEIKRSRRNLCPLTVTYVDLDNFKLVNKILGYTAADDVLRVVARTMQSSLREMDVVARLHGDEFALLLPETCALDAPLALGKLQKALRESMTVNQWPVTFSIGAVTFDTPLATPEEMKKAASNVMQSSAKLGGKDRVRHVPFDLRDKAEYCVECSICRTTFIATAHPFCPLCGDAVLSDSQPAQTNATESKRVSGICAFRLPLHDGKTIEFYGPANIAEEQVEAVISTANSSLTGNGGVDKAIHHAGGPSILAECKKIVAKSGRLPAGKAVITAGGQLPAKYVIHTVGPFYHEGESNEAQTLPSCFRESIRLADDHAIHSVAFPSISTGGSGYPVIQAARVAVSSVVHALTSTKHGKLVRFVLFDASTLRAYTAAGEEFELVDSLTGLSNSRRMFSDLDHALSTSGQEVALVLVDVDELEKISRKYGQSVSANVLRSVGCRLSNQHSQRAALYRWGGDEFAAILVGADKADVLNLAEAIRADMAGLSFEGHPELSVTIRVGVAFSPDDGRTMDRLMQSADAAAYQAHKDGGNCVRASYESNARPKSA
jgi:diguanylate cyclase (GGDEF)-like protein